MRVKSLCTKLFFVGLLVMGTYDASGNTLCNLGHRNPAFAGTAYTSGTATERTWYLRDASGALLCYHKQDLVAPSTADELPIPGVGTYLRSTTNVRYELTDHLGNTRVSFTYASNVITVVEAHDYYPHGGLLPGRQLTSTGASPLAYQGQEYDAEVGLTAFNLRQYDARLGRWLTPDPYGQHHSPYLAMSNNPVLFVDPDGGYDWQNYHNDSQAEALAGLQQMRQATNPEYYADQLTSARLANGQELNMNDMITVTMLRFYERHPEKGESEEYHYEDYQSGCEGCRTSESGAILAPEGTDFIIHGGARIVHEKTDAYYFWLTTALSETKGALGELMRNNHAFSSALVQNPNLSNELRGQALVMRNTDEAKALNAFIMAILPMPGVGAASGGVRAAMPLLARSSQSTRAFSSVLLNSAKQLQGKFKHAADFGVAGNYSKSNAASFSSALNRHINSTHVQAIRGTYRKQPVVHYLNSTNGLNVISSPSGQFISGWKLNPAQMRNVQTHGGL